VNGFQVLLGLGALAVGCLNLFFPHVAFFLQEGWKFRDVEPSDLFITLTQVSGIVFIGIGVLVLALGLVLG
jgi:hypothetical protein